MRALVALRPGLRVPGAFDGFELVVRAIVGQQISVAGARTILGRIAARAGTHAQPCTEGPSATEWGPIETGAREPGAVEPVRAESDAAPSILFPTAEDLVHADLTGLGLTTRRIETLKIVSRMVAEGRIDLDGGGDPGETSAALLEVPGIGPWTVGYIALRALGDPDAWPTGDLALTKAMERLSIPPDQVDRWRPWRSYAAVHLWNA
jgi:AraC family transcriptional regulator of adaptative response / DNA-3-methyladenine glycosylase II